MTAHHSRTTTAKTKAGDVRARGVGEGGDEIAFIALSLLVVVPGA